MKIKTSELSGVALDWAVAQVEKVPVYFERMGLGYWREISKLPGAEFIPYAPSTDWSQCGPLIEKNRIEFTFERDGVLFAEMCNADGNYCVPYTGMYGHTYLISACRAIVSAKLGDEVEVPEELL